MNFDKPRVTGRVGAMVSLADGKTFELNEGSRVEELTYWNDELKRDVTVSGTVRSIIADTKTNHRPRPGSQPAAISPDICGFPMMPYLHMYVKPTDMIIDSSTKDHAVFTNVHLDDIRSIENVFDRRLDPKGIVVGPGYQYLPLNEVISRAPEGSVIQLLPGLYHYENLVLDKSITLVGLMGGVGFSSPLEIRGADTKVELRNITFTGNGHILVNGASEFRLVNCILGGYRFDSTIVPVTVIGETPILLIADNNSFGATVDVEKVPTLIGCEAPLRDGSSISENRFFYRCCSGSQIVLHAVDENKPVISISNNYAAMSANMVSLTLANNPKCTFALHGNEYSETSSESALAGLFSVAPYHGTTSLAGVTLEVTETIHPDEKQIGYVCAVDGVLDSTELPEVWVDGLRTDIPYYSHN